MADDDPVAVVTGAASGIGAATVRQLLAAGFRVVAADRSPAGGPPPVGVVAVRADVTVEDDVVATVHTALTTFGRLDVAVNCAGTPSVALDPMHEIGTDDWRRVIAVNLDGLWLSMKHEVGAMLECGGAIVNVTSRAGTRATRHMAAYVASKHGAVGLTKAAALDYADRGVRVNAICPGPTATAMLEQVVAHDPSVRARLEGSVPMGRLGTADEVARTAVWLAGPGSSFVTGAVLAVDGGSTA